MTDKTPDIPKIDTTRPSAARMYDYYLGGFHNFEADRQAAEQVLQVYPAVRVAARANRAFLRRAVEFMVSQGIDQFLDLGSGIPTVGNVHEVAQAANPEARVVYVDIDPIAVAHGRAILEGNERVTVIQADARDVESILNHPEVQQLLDFSRPIGILAIAFLHFIDDEGVGQILDTLKQLSVSGSYLAITHSSDGEELGPEVQRVIQMVQAIYAKSQNPLYFRKLSAIEAMFAGWQLVEPGLVTLPLWRPEDEEDPMVKDVHMVAGWYGGVAVKP